MHSFIDWSVLSPAEMKLIEKSTAVINLRKNDVVYEEGTFPKGVYQIKKGMIKLVIRMSDGSEQIVFVYKPGETFGFRPIIAKEMSSAIAIALQPCQLEFIPAEVFLSVLDSSPAFSRALLKILCKEFTMWINRMAFTAQKDVKQRLALSLLILNEKFKAPESIVSTSVIHISRTELAGYIGTSLETIIRTLKKFTQEKLIRVNGKKIILLNERPLISIAGI